MGRALAALAGERPDVADILAHLVVDCAETSGAVAAAVLARESPGRGLGLLAASSHRAAELEVWQAQHHSGPCYDAIAESRTVHRSAEAQGTGAGTLGGLMQDAGLQAVTSYPVVWRGITLAGLSLFWSSAGLSHDELTEPGPVFADLVALVIAHPALQDTAAVQARLRRSMAERAVIEQAKGVLAWTERLDMADAYTRLLALTASSSATLTEVATDVVRRRGAPPS